MGIIDQEIKKRKILLVSDGLFPSVLLCGKNQLDYLATKGLIDFKFVLSIQLNRKYLDWADTVVFVRSCEDFELECARAVKESGRGVVYVMDDDLLNLPNDVSCANQFRGKQDNILKFISVSDVLLTPNRNLAKTYGQYASRTELIEEPGYAYEKIQRKREGPIRIGFAGSLDRSLDINSILRSSVERILLKYGKDHVSFEFFGAYPDFAKQLGLKHINYVDSYKQYCSAMLSLNWDIGLAPMPETDFHKNKYYNKYIEYSSYGIPTIYSDYEPYMWVVKNGENGILVKNNPEEWYIALCKLIDDAELRERIGNTCWKDIRNHFSLEKLSVTYLNALPKSNVDIRPVKVKIGALKTGYFLKRYMTKIGKYGWKTPVVFVRKLRALLEQY